MVKTPLEKAAKAAEKRAAREAARASRSAAKAAKAAEKRAAREAARASRSAAKAATRKSISAKEIDNYNIPILQMNFSEHELHANKKEGQDYQELVDYILVLVNGATECQLPFDVGQLPYDAAQPEFPDEFETLFGLETDGKIPELTGQEVSAFFKEQNLTISMS